MQIPAGSSVRSGLRGPGRMPTPIARPTPASVNRLIALVSRKRTAERSAIRPVAMPRSRSSQAPTAMLPAPPSETAAPNAISVNATRAPNTIGARSNTVKKIST